MKCWRVSREAPTFRLMFDQVRFAMPRFLFPALCSVLLMFPWMGSLSAQRPLGQQALNEAPMLFLNANYAGMVPLGDLADRFGAGFSAGFQVEWMSWPNNWILGIDGQYGFAGKVKENVLDFLQDEDGNIVGRDLDISKAFLQQRLVSGKVTIGRLFPLFESNKRSGIRFSLGTGFQMHWIKVNDELRSLAQTEGDYGAGYDRLTAGWLVSEFLGYQHVSLNRRINFYAGVDVGQAFGRSLRTYDYSTMQQDDRTRLDMTLTFRAGWCIPLWTGTGTTDIYY